MRSEHKESSQGSGKSKGKNLGYYRMSVFGREKNSLVVYILSFECDLVSKGKMYKAM